MKTFKLLKPAFSIKAFVVTAFVLILGGILARQVATLLEAAEAPEWTVISAVLVSSTAMILLAFMAIPALWRIGIAITAIIANLLALEESTIGNIPEEAQPVQAAMDDLARVLSEIRPNAQEADTRLTDARTKAETMASLVIGLVEKTANLERQLQALHDALAAIETGQRDKVAMAAGKIDSAVIRRCLGTPHVLTRPDYRADVVTLISSDIGTVEHWRDSYTRYTTALFGQVMEIERRVAALEAGREFLQATEPLIEIRQNLNAASEALQLKRPDVRYTARMTLPGDLSQHLLKGDR